MVAILGKHTVLSNLVMGRVTGFEPATSSTTNWRSNLLSYTRQKKPLDAVQHRRRAKHTTSTTHRSELSRKRLTSHALDQDGVCTAHLSSRDPSPQQKILLLGEIVIAHCTNQHSRNKTHTTQPEPACMPQYPKEHRTGTPNTSTWTALHRPRNETIARAQTPSRRLPTLRPFLRRALDRMNST
jgi:hypothetical protein